MEPSRDEILLATLESLKPTPSPAFAAELDARVAAGFPRESASTTAPFARLAAWLGALRPRQLVVGGCAAALVALVVATVIVAAGSSSGVRDQIAVRSGPAEPPASTGELNRTPRQIEENFDAAGAGKHSASGGPSNAGAEYNGSSGIEYEAGVPAVGGAKSGGSAAAEAPAAGGAEVESTVTESTTTVPTEKAGPNSGPYASQAHHRDVEYAAEMVLGAKPEDVGDAAGKVFDAVHQYGGIVLDSSVRGGSASDAGAEFELLIPSAKLGDALAAFSGIAEVRSRHETSNDITAPTVTTTELLQDSHARVESLLNQLAETETEAEQEAVEAKLRAERRHAAVLKSSLTNLRRRANFSHVALRIESGAADSSSGAGGWDVGDAFHDAGQILAAAAGVAIVGLAILGPIALIALLVWLGNRAWLRQRRERALG